MATRAIYTFKNKSDPKDTGFRVYNHWDNYPSGAYHLIKNALSLAWQLPRFEADEFACAFIAANKERAGGFRLLPPEVTDMGQDFEYLITCENGQLIIEFDYWGEDSEGVDTALKFKGTLEEMESLIDKLENE